MSDPIEITMKSRGATLTAVCVWTEELGCYIGSFTHLPEIKRTGCAPGDVFDALCEIEHESIAAAMGLVFGG